MAFPAAQGDPETPHAEERKQKSTSSVIRRGERFSGKSKCIDEEAGRFV